MAGVLYGRMPLVVYQGDDNQGDDNHSDDNHGDGNHGDGKHSDSKWLLLQRSLSEVFEFSSKLF